MSVALSQGLTRAKLLDVLRDVGEKGVLRSDLLLAHNIGNVHAHIESLRFDGYAITGKPDTDARGWTDTRYVLTPDPADPPHSGVGSATGGEPGSQPPSGSPARDVSLGEPSDKKEDST